MSAQRLQGYFASHSRVAEDLLVPWLSANSGLARVGFAGLSSVASLDLSHDVGTLYTGLPKNKPNGQLCRHGSPEQLAAVVDGQAAASGRLETLTLDMMRAQNLTAWQKPNCRADSAGFYSCPKTSGFGLWALGWSWVWAMTGWMSVESSLSAQSGD